MCHQSLSHALPEALFCSPGPQLTVFMSREGVGVALVAQVVTYRGSPEGCLIYTVFTKKCQKWTKKGAPPVFNRKIECTTYWVSFRDPKEGPRGSICCPFWSI